MLSSAHHFPTAFLFCLGLSFAAPAQQRTQAPLDNQRIIQLTQSGVHSDELQRIIASAPEVNFLLNPASTDVMLKAGVSEDVIKAMAAREVNSVSRERARQADPVATSETGNIDSVHARPEPKKEKHKQPKAKATPSRNILNIDTTGFTPLNARIIQQAQERYRNEELLKQMQEDLQRAKQERADVDNMPPQPSAKAYRGTPQQVYAAEVLAVGSTIKFASPEACMVSSRTGWSQVHWQELDPLPGQTSTQFVRNYTAETIDWTLTCFVAPDIPGAVWIQISFQSSNHDMLLWHTQSDLKVLWSNLAAHLGPSLVERK